MRLFAEDTIGQHVNLRNAGDNVMKKNDLINCICKLEGSGSFRRKILAKYTEKQLRRLLIRMTRQDIELTELQCASMFI